MTFPSNPDYFPVCDYYFLTQSWRYLFADKTGFALFFLVKRWKNIEANMLSVSVFNLVGKPKFIQENERRTFQKHFLPVPRPGHLWFSPLHGWGTAWFQTRSREGDQAEPLFTSPSTPRGALIQGLIQAYLSRAFILIACNILLLSPPNAMELWVQGEEGFSCYLNEFPRSCTLTSGLDT